MPDVVFGMDRRVILIHTWAMKDKASGTWRVARLWLFLLADLFVSVPVQLMRGVLQDGRYMLRLWARHPLHTGFMIAALAIGIGATTGGFIYEHSDISS
jgi:protein-S-isoprenylcysteine O-methyltransferase Ste14